MSDGLFTIHKYPLPIDADEFAIEMPSGIHLSLQVQNGVPCLWAAVMPETAEAGERRPARFVWVGTGKPIPAAIKDIRQAFLGTAQLYEGRLVLHLFRLGTFPL